MKERWGLRQKREAMSSSPTPGARHLLIAWAPFSSPFTVASPFFGGLGWETAAVAAAAAGAAVTAGAAVAAVAAAAAAAAAATAAACC